jgi:hypothetical protein
MLPKNKKETLSKRIERDEARLEQDEHSWLKVLESMGDFARYWQRLEAQEKKSIKRINMLENRIVSLEEELRKIKESLKDDVGNK